MLHARTMHGMKRSIVAASLALWLAVSVTAFGQSILDVVSQVSENSYKSYLGYPSDGGNLLYTHAGYDRQWSSYHDLAQTNIFNHFTGLGLTTSLDSFSYSGNTYYNVVAVQPGAVRPNDNPNYHTANDNVDTPNYLDYTYATEMTKGAVGYLAGSAVIVLPEPATWVLLVAGGIVGVIVRLRQR